MSVKSKSKIDKNLELLDDAYRALLEVLEGEVYEQEKDLLLKKSDPDILIDSGDLELALDGIKSVLKQAKKLGRTGP